MFVLSRRLNISRKKRNTNANWACITFPVGTKIHQKKFLSFNAPPKRLSSWTFSTSKQPCLLVFEKGDKSPTGNIFGEFVLPVENPNLYRNDLASEYTALRKYQILRGFGECNFLLAAYNYCCKVCLGGRLVLKPTVRPTSLFLWQARIPGTSRALGARQGIITYKTAAKFPIAN